MLRWLKRAVAHLTCACCHELRVDPSRCSRCGAYVCKMCADVFVTGEKVCLDCRKNKIREQQGNVGLLIKPCWIKTNRRAYGWTACLAETPAIWEAGRTEQEAIGKLKTALAWTEATRK